MEQSQYGFTWRWPWSFFKNISCFSLKVGTIPHNMKNSVYLRLGRKQHARHKSQVSDALLNRKCTWVKYIWGGLGRKRGALCIKMSFTWTFLETYTTVAVRFRIFYVCTCWFESMGRWKNRMSVLSASRHPSLFYQGFRSCN